MRETLRNWKDEWISTNGYTDDLEVLVKDCNLDDSAPYIYEGSFSGLPEKLENLKVVKWARVIDSSAPERIGAYSLTVYGAEAEYIYDNENGHYVWYNSFADAFSHIDLCRIVEDDRKVI